jgi:hypothetical protein
MKKKIESTNSVIFWFWGFTRRVGYTKVPAFTYSPCKTPKPKYQYSSHGGSLKSRTNSVFIATFLKFTLGFARQNFMNHTPMFLFNHMQN